MLILTKEDPSIRKRLYAESILRNIQRAKDYGYYIELYYVGLESADLAKKRVAQRVIAGGHGIPDADIERRYKESLEHLRAVVNLCVKMESVWIKQRLYHYGVKV